MKKMVSLMLSLALVFTSVSCFAAAPEATAHSVQKNVFIEGKVDTYVEGAVLALTLTVGDEVVYVNEYDTVDKDGSYTIKFKHTGDLNEANINVKYAGEEATSSLVNVVATSQIMEADVLITDASDRSYVNDLDFKNFKNSEVLFAAHEVGGEVVMPRRTYTSDYVPEDRSGLKAIVKITNKLANDNENVSVMVAAYDENNKLLACEIKTFEMDYGLNGEIQTKEAMMDIPVPENTAKAKAFCWSSTDNLVAFGEQADGTLPKVDVFCHGDSYGQVYWSNFYPESGWGAHIGDYFNSKYVTVTSYCTSGGWAQAIMSNTNDPKYQQNIKEGKDGKNGMYGWDDWKDMEANPEYGKGDYVIVSLGINDQGKLGPGGMSAVDWFGLALEEMAIRTKEKGANLIICSPLLRPYRQMTTDDALFAEKAQEVANKYGVPYLDVITSLQTEYMKKFDTDDEVFRAYYLVRDVLLASEDEGGYGMTKEELAYHAQGDMHPDGSGYNAHPTVKGADNMTRHMAELLKKSNSDLRFYLK